MPIYEFQCNGCNKVVEAWLSLSDKPLETCPACSGSMRKLISRSAFHLKGGGWYADGYSGAKGAGCGGDKCPAAKSSSSDSPSCPAASGDAKPASCPKSDGAACCA
jgi:putative FmdB family regulatory protein